MDIYKAIKKEKIHFKIFLITMVIILIILPIVISNNWINYYILYKLCDFY